ncbi:MAG: transposase [Candidatus Eiseniibacteriota bacterium]
MCLRRQFRSSDVGSDRGPRSSAGWLSRPTPAGARPATSKRCSPTAGAVACCRDPRSLNSEITESLWEEYESFSTRVLSDLKTVYLFVDGIAERLRPGSKREAVLAAWAITEAGQKILVAVAPGTKESTDCCRDFFEDLKRRGLEDPVQVISDGAAGLIAANEQCFPVSLRQRCPEHKIRNLISKLPSEAIAEFKQVAKASYQAPSPAMARALRDDLVERFGKKYPSVVRCLLDDFEACIAHLRCPAAHHRLIRTTNLLERLFGEERRRFKAVGTTFGERPVLKLMYSTLVRASDRWRGIQITEFETRQLDVLRQQLNEEHRRENDPAAAVRGKRGPRDLQQA